MKLTKPTPRSTESLLILMLPGQDRKRLPAQYWFRATHRNPNPNEIGCVMTWEVGGGRLAYQVSLERTDAGELRWHCTCADAVYRGDKDPQHTCKHVSGLVESMPLAATATRRAA